MQGFLVVVVLLLLHLLLLLLILILLVPELSRGQTPPDIIIVSAMHSAATCGEHDCYWDP
eukprot:4049976-Pyramimonas_sp.AAC.1